MITRSTIALCILFSWILQVSNLAAQSASTTAQGLGGTVFLHETFDSYAAGSVPQTPTLRRAELVNVVEGQGQVGSGNVAHFDDSDTKLSGAMEYNVGASGPGRLYLEFDALNHAPLKGDGSSSMIFGVGTWDTGKGLVLHAKSTRAFGFEMYQQKYLKLRVGDKTTASMHYDPATGLNVKIWVNDNDTNTLSYKRPDTGDTSLLDPDSVVVWVNNSLIDELPPSGCPMNREITKGDTAVGRVGFSSASTKVSDFLIDNLHMEDPLGQSQVAAPKPKAVSEAEEVTPASMPGAETKAYREGDNAMNLFVFKPDGWQADDKRSAFIYFFGGGWTSGTPLRSASVAAWAAENGMVGIAPDYRTKNRFGTSPLASVADGRAAFAWAVEHADELGIDPTRIAVGGTSAGGHVAMWTAIDKSPPGSEPATQSNVKPAAVFLSSAVTDTSPDTGYTPSRFGDDAISLSPVHQLSEKMPPVVMFHAANDKLVQYSTAVTLYHKLTSTGNACELITVPQGGHGFSSEFPDWKMKVREKMIEQFKREGLLPAVR
ncbi:Lipase 2 [Rubripirellula tenax]|uniref:Lipase 2 n=1 Tax=Rubripirellula tenax TaxID=2528015 RepID=A0A5C6EEG7_9BACT|nr:alpha/beta hydrolase [Rubripirellula tenax]TWU46121.1 Lipase 2 [Rubripirellula tenax]